MSLRGPLYTALYEDEVIMAASVQPLFDTCRVFQTRGCCGLVEMWDDIRPYPRMRTTVEKGARLTVEEGDGPPRFRKWKCLPLPVRQPVGTIKLSGGRKPTGLGKLTKSEPTAPSEFDSIKSVQNKFQRKAAPSSG